MRETSRNTTAPRAHWAGSPARPAQIDALNRYRSHGEPDITVQNVSVAEGGKAVIRTLL